jgi:NADH dehydrogenase [ubiquinone] 1 alpha subcomplex assembly factor 7
MDENGEKSIVLIAHEFFDALPRHAFQRTETGVWRELLLGLDANSDFCLTSSTTPTKIQIALDNDLRLSGCKSDAVEMSPESLRIAGWIRTLLRKNRPSLAIITDYGSISPPGFTLRAIKGHKMLQTITEDIGECDISGDVDFGSFLEIFKEGLKSEIFYQGEFLQRMGIGQRARELIHQNRQVPEAAGNISREYHRLVDPKQMGSIYKILTIES